ncbi:hypothetical protein A3B51_01375 [Candidatus Curtissbacteria bacterium RIFCSPLOWO2_01_FULL_41_18]|uniref:Uncharacterized protein n=2 Tax=Candidatus Curtissiibacteriota TaxID=1752717 RepID=A0A1F5FZ64_9BACT|nr:MAG: hypothetical protein A2696_00535 [Candidatus Curtissbacteria bacterium RIFCSPHIGHO2_01_FULL_41_13]OGE03873.1 MAG: hypothetical protein A3B51_01375 [Candidatus Curtissbacteria bacterium RIFCSPLOWO2_01_FULL_41_18]
MHKKLRQELIKQMVILSTSGFGLVAALAWNDAIQAFVKEYIDKYISVGSGIISRFIYAIVITIFAVIITYQLTKISGEEEKK